MPKTLNDIDAALGGLSARAITSVFLVACGGSLSIMHPGKCFLDAYSSAVSCDVFNADEFVSRKPKRLGPSSLVILCSQTGNTRETVGAAKYAKAKGAYCIGMTLDPKSSLAQEVNAVVQYKASYATGFPIDAADSNYSVLYLLLAGLLRRTDGIDCLAKLMSSLERLQPAIDNAHLTFKDRFEAYAPRFQGASAIYTLAAGPCYGAAYSYSTCVLMEMQRFDSQAIHANEFFHGPFEVVDDKTCVIVLVGLDDTRRLTERALRFLERFASNDRILSLDAKELSLEEIEPEFAPYLVPLIFFDSLWKFAYKLAALRNLPMLEGRRYMKKINDY